MIFTIFLDYEYADQVLHAYPWMKMDAERKVNMTDAHAIESRWGDRGLPFTSERIVPKMHSPYDILPRRATPSPCSSPRDR